MQIKSIKELEQVIKLCKKHAIPYIEVANVKLTLNLQQNSKKATKNSTISNLQTQDELVKVPAPNIAPQREATVNTQNATDPRILAMLDEQNTSLDPIDTPDQLTEEQLLFYSAQGHAEVL